MLLVGGSDKTISNYTVNNGGALTKAWTIPVDSPPRSIDLYNGQVLMGLKNGSICVMSYSAEAQANARITTVMTSHCDGEVWGITVCQLENGETRIITSGDDNRLLAYNPSTWKVLCEGKVSDPPAKKPSKEKGGYKGGASSMSSQPAGCQSRCVTYNSALNQLAVANNKGIVTIREIDWAAVDAGTPGALDNVKKTLFSKVKKAEWIETMQFSPCNKYLAIGSHDNFIYLYDTKTYSDSKAHKLTGHSSFITSIDWSQDSKWIRTVCGAYELLFFDIGKYKRDPSGASNTVEVMWCDQTNKLGWNVQGIFPSGCDGSHINGVAMSSD